MSNGKPNFLKSILTLAMLSALEEKVKSEGKEHLLKENKQFDELMAELDKIFGIKPKEPVKDTSGSMKPNKSFFDEFKEENKSKKKAEQQTKFMDDVLPVLEMFFLSKIGLINTMVGKEDFANVKVQRVTDAKTVGDNKAFFVNQIYKGFFIGISVNKVLGLNEFSNIKYLTRNTDGGYIEFDDFDQFINGVPNKLIGLKEIIMCDLHAGKLK